MYNTKTRFATMTLTTMLFASFSGAAYAEETTTTTTQTPSAKTSATTTFNPDQRRKKNYTMGLKKDVTGGDVTADLNVTGTVKQKPEPGTRDTSPCKYKHISTENYDRGLPTVYYNWANFDAQDSWDYYTFKFPDEDPSHDAYQGPDVPVEDQRITEANKQKPKIVYNYSAVECPGDIAKVYMVKTPTDVQARVEAVLAKHASATLHLPEPGAGILLGRDAASGNLYTLVNGYTWFWTKPGVFQPLTKTVTIDNLAVTMFAVPVSLEFDPGDGHSPKVCQSAGSDPATSRTKADYYNRSPSWCDYKYEKTTVRHRDRYPDGKLTGSLSIRWRISWEGPQGSNGVMGDMLTTTKQRFVVGELHNLVVG